MLVRQMEPKDIQQVTALCEQFGYPTSTEDVDERFRHLRHMSEHQVFVAEDVEGIIG